MNTIEVKKLQELRKELENLEKQGVSLKLGESLCTPDEIVHAHAVAEPGSYMRDYIPGERGEVKQIEFDYINDKHKN